MTWYDFVYFVFPLIYKTLHACTHTYCLLDTSSHSGMTPSTVPATSVSSSSSSTTVTSTSGDDTTANLPATYSYDPTSGFYYDSSTGLYYDPKTQVTLCLHVYCKTSK